MRVLYSILFFLLTLQLAYGSDTASVLSMCPTQGKIGESVSFICSKLPSDKFKVIFSDNIEVSVAYVRTLSDTNRIFSLQVPVGAKTGLVKLVWETPSLDVSAGTFTISSTKDSNEPENSISKGTSLPSGRAGDNSNSGSLPGSKPPRPKIDLDMDLPVDAPIFGWKPEDPPKPPTPDVPIPENPPTFYGKDLESPNGTIMYVIDISGSMANWAGPYVDANGNTVSEGTRLDRAKAELIRSIKALPSSFKFNVDAFDCSVYAWKTSLQKATKENKTSAIQWVEKLNPQGATGTGFAMAMALQIRECKLYVLLTDGQPNCGAGDGSGSVECMESHRKMINNSNTQRAQINVFGISAYGYLRDFCIGVATDSSGTYADVK